MKNKDVLYKIDRLYEAIKDENFANLYDKKSASYTFANRMVNISHTLYLDSVKENFNLTPSADFFENIITNLKELLKISSALDFLYNKEKMLDEFIKNNNIKES